MVYYYYAKTAICIAQNKHVTLSLPLYLSRSRESESPLCIFKQLIALVKKKKKGKGNKYNAFRENRD